MEIFLELVTVVVSTSERGEGMREYPKSTFISFRINEKILSFISKSFVWSFRIYFFFLVSRQYQHSLEVLCVLCVKDTFFFRNFIRYHHYRGDLSWAAVTKQFEWNSISQSEFDVMICVRQQTSRREEKRKNVVQNDPELFHNQPIVVICSNVPHAKKSYSMLLFESTIGGSIKKQ